MRGRPRTIAQLAGRVAVRGVTGMCLFKRVRHGKEATLSMSLAALVSGWKHLLRMPPHLKASGEARHCEQM
jgi:hypothetical protein